MSRLIETLRVEDGKWNNLPYHEQRMQRSLRDLFDVTGDVSLAARVKEVKIPEQGLFKCRVIYTADEMNFEVEPYTIRPVLSLKMIESDQISYAYKFADRKAIAHNFEQRGNSDDILMIKNGKVTDTSYANIVFRRLDKWLTPSSCLLPGTQRQYLLDQKLIEEDDIAASQVSNFSFFKLINSMLMWDGREVTVENIIHLK